MSDEDIIIDDSEHTIILDVNVSDGAKAKNVHIAVSGESLEQCYSYVVKVSKLISDIKYEDIHTTDKHRHNK